MSTNNSSTKLKGVKKSATSAYPGFSHIQTVGGIEEFCLRSNGLRVLYHHIPNTGVVTTNIVYHAGARDEVRGESGLAHMLEHMLFKPTKQDKARGIDSGAMQFERETGVLLNANTWKDRTCYYFSYPKEHFKRALTIEAERMRDVILDDAEFQPERSNVLSEFDMYNGNPEFALAMALCSTAFHSHPYGHETIGFRQDIETYTVEKLKAFYDHFYRPNNAVLMIIGDIDLKTALREVKTIFSPLEAGPTQKSRPHIVEPPQEGLRRVEIVRPGNTQMVAIAVRHPAFPSKGWYETALILQLLCDGPDSMLHKKHVDTGVVAGLTFGQEPTGEENIAIINLTAAKNIPLDKIENAILSTIKKLDQKTITSYYKKLLAKNLTAEIFGRDSSLAIANELTEYVATGDWTAYTKIEEILKNITPQDLFKRKEMLFKDNNVSIGIYRSI